MITVKYEDIEAAFDFVSFGAPMEHSAYVSLDTGAIYWVSDANEEEVPDDLEESDRYLAIPHKNDLDLGTDLALGFVEEKLPDQYRQVENFFRHRGAYARFKDLLAAERCLDEWYAFEVEATKKALMSWCKENGIQIVENSEGPV